MCEEWMPTPAERCERMETKKAPRSASVRKLLPTLQFGKLPHHQEMLRTDLAGIGLHLHHLMREGFDLP